MTNKKEYQTGTATASQIEDGFLSAWLIERSKNGWTLKSLEKYFSKKNDEDSFLWILEREIEELKQNAS
jgi:hypothetical protein